MRKKGVKQTCMRRLPDTLVISLYVQLSEGFQIMASNSYFLYLGSLNDLSAFVKVFFIENTATLKINVKAFHKEPCDTAGIS